MCDTQIIRQNNSTFFAKNSDREASEPQIIVRFPPVQNDTAKTLKTTYLTIPQAANRYGVILSKPCWIWGGEMGINDQGVVIGNEAIFSRLVDRKGQSLLGMDLLRLGLERGENAHQAMDVICGLLEQYGQGGPAGFRDKSFRYDNSFIIADAQESWLLETAGKNWAAKKIDSHFAISNALTIGADYEMSKEGVGHINFAKTNDTRFMALMGAAHKRQAASMKNLEAMAANKSASLENMIASLRSHYQPDQRFSRHDNRDVCMHAGSLLRPSQTCSSMVVQLQVNQIPEVMMTGTSAPCLSLFKAINFESSSRFTGTDASDGQDSLWFQFESVHRRALLDAEFRDELCRSRDLIEKQVLMVFKGRLTWQEVDQLSLDWHQSWYQKAIKNPFKYHLLSYYQQFWRRLNQRDGIL